ncbi:ABC transporter permease [Acrocarpospora sp. B8E8]|uniref:ABC transporter permease n=1 Tax=Acrocarpospora sp. B8E8 TaxID=3153572 RepID=UPI00325EF95E
MLNMRGRKTLRDLWLQRGRAGLVVVAMALGVFGVVWITSSSEVLSRELRAQFLATSPASATLRADGLTPQVLADVRAMPGVGLAETATTLQSRVKIGPSDYKPLVLFSRTDFAASTIAMLKAQDGTWPPPPGEIVIERAAMGVAQTRIGDTIEVTVPGGKPRTIRVAGTVHDLGQAPAWQDGLAYGYVTPDTLARLGFDPKPTELRIVVDGDRLDPAHIDAVASTVADRLRDRGVQITQVLAPEPAVHPHQTQMDSLLWLQQSFGVLALLLSALLVATLMTALLAGQVRQIGAMKAVGARAGQIVVGYAAMVMVLGLASLAIGWPLGQLATDGYITAVTAILNFDVEERGLPIWLVVGQLAVGLVVPLVAAAFPVLRAARATTAIAMRDHGATAPATRPTRRARTPRRPAGLRLPGLSRMAARNVVRRRARLAVTMIALALGGSAFIAALNLSTSLNVTMQGQSDALRYGIAVNLTRPYPAEQVAALVRDVPGVATAETWLSTKVGVGDTPTTEYTPSLYGVPADTPMLALPVLSGRWLKPGENRGIVISHNLAKDYPALKVGDDVQLRIDGRFGTWHVVGIVRQVAAPPTAWTTYDALAGVLGGTGTTNAVRVMTGTHDTDALVATRKAVDDALTAAGIDVASNSDTAESQQVLSDHIIVIVVFLGALTLLSVLIGGLGLATTMAINVIERTREIGVLRAVGATTVSILTLVVTEGGIIGALSWLAALVLAVPASIVFGQVIGEIFLETPLDFAVNGLAPFVWLAIVIVLSALASLTPARRAAALTVRETLAYQ